MQVFTLNKALRNQPQAGPYSSKAHGLWALPHMKFCHRYEFLFFLIIVAKKRLFGFFSCQISEYF
jgi:hypothetical protein